MENKKNFKCILCQKEIKGLGEHNIHAYEYYVEGAGPLCADCYNKKHSA